MRLTELKKGQVWMLDHPRRIVRVGEPETIEIQVMKSVGGGQVPDIENVAAIRVKVAMPDRAIEGFQDAEDAEMIAELVQSVLRSPDRIKGSMWEEVWAERAVGKLQNPVRSAAKVLEVMRMQLYCAESHGRQQKQDRSSPVVNGEISGKLIPAELVPADQFEARKLLRPGRKCAGCQGLLAETNKELLCQACSQALSDFSKRQYEDSQKAKAGVLCVACGKDYSGDANRHTHLCSVCEKAARQANEPPKMHGGPPKSKSAKAKAGV